jgi:agmatine deiminase
LVSKRRLALRRPEENALSTPSPRLRKPAEWTPHEATWLAFPAHADLWGENLAPARRAFVALCEGIASGPAATREELRILVRDAGAEETARAALGHLAPRFHRIPYGDIWLRDTAPIFVRDGAGAVTPSVFAFNGWGGKYVLPGDEGVARAIAALSDLTSRAFPWVLEGGSVEVDGEGTVLTTRQCLLHENRNPGMDQAAIERGLAEALGAERVLWLGEGLLNDHTDGHVDTLARFVAPGVVVAMEPTTAGDPNRDALHRILADLRGMRDAAGRLLEVVTMPSPGRILDEEGAIMPASYVNFYIANHAVVVPTYGVPADESAVGRVAALFPGRRTSGVDARAILSGGGAFHCITQQVPRGGDQ